MRTQLSSCQVVKEGCRGYSRLVMDARLGNLYSPTRLRVVHSKASGVSRRSRFIFWVIRLTGSSQFSIAPMGARIGSPRMIQDSKQKRARLRFRATVL